MLFVTTAHHKAALINHFLWYLNVSLIFGWWPPLSVRLCGGGKRILSKGAMATESRREIKPPHIPSAGLQEELQRPSDRPAGSNTGSENHRRSIERTFHLLWPPTRESLPAIKPGRWILEVLHVVGVFNAEKSNASCMPQFPVRCAKLS